MGVTRGDSSRVCVQVNAVPMIKIGGLTPYAVVVTFIDVTHAREATRMAPVEDEGLFNPAVGGSAVVRWWLLRIA